MLLKLNQAQMYVQALQAACKQYAQSNGPVKTSRVSYKKISRKFQQIDTQKAEQIINQAGFQLIDIAKVELTQDSIIAKLGKEKGNKVISQLKQAGAVRSFSKQYWRLSIK